MARRKSGKRKYGRKHNAGGIASLSSPFQAATAGFRDLSPYKRAAFIVAGTMGTGALYSQVFSRFLPASFKSGYLRLLPDLVAASLVAAVAKVVKKDRAADVLTGGILFAINDLMEISKGTLKGFDDDLDGIEDFASPAQVSAARAIPSWWGKAHPGMKGIDDGSFGPGLYDYAGVNQAQYAQSALNDVDAVAEELDSYA